MKNGVLEGLVVGAAPGAGGIVVLGPPGGVSGHVAYVGAQRVQAPCDELV